MEERELIPPLSMIQTLVLQIEITPCMYVCVCMCVCVYVHACMCVCVCMHACVCVYACMHVCEWVWVCVVRHSGASLIHSLLTYVLVVQRLVIKFVEGGRHCAAYLLNGSTLLVILRNKTTLKYSLHIFFC